MSELELALVNLGRELDYPETPDLGGAVRRRLAEGRRPLQWRRPLVIAVAALLVVVAAVLAVPQARSHVLDWLGIGSVTIHRVDELPAIESRDDLELGRRVTLEQARERAQFPIRVPALDELGEPAFYFRREIGAVSLLYGSERQPKVLITELIAPGAVDKLVTAETGFEPVREGDWSGAWLEGDHVLYIPTNGDALRLAGNTLVVRGPDAVTVRIEADVSKQEAIRILRSMG